MECCNVRFFNMLRHSDFRICGRYLVSMVRIRNAAPWHRASDVFDLFFEAVVCSPFDLLDDFVYQRVILLRAAGMAHRVFSDGTASEAYLLCLASGRRSRFNGRGALPNSNVEMWLVHSGAAPYLATENHVLPHPYRRPPPWRCCRKPRMSTSRSMTGLCASTVVYRAQGAGGQHVTRPKSAGANHPSATASPGRSRPEKSQHKNKAQAMSCSRPSFTISRRPAAAGWMAPAPPNASMVGSGDRSERIALQFPPQGGGHRPSHQP